MRVWHAALCPPTLNRGIATHFGPIPFSCSALSPCNVGPIMFSCSSLSPCNVGPIMFSCSALSPCNAGFCGHGQGKSQYCTPVGPSIYIPTVKPHIKGNIWEWCVVTLESRGPWVPTGPLWEYHSMVETQRLPDSVAECVAECLVVWDLCHAISTTTAATVTKTRTLVTTAKPEGHTVAGKAGTTTGNGDS